MHSDARISDVVHLLDDPIDYVRGVIECLYSYPSDRKAAVVRIGIWGKGIIPNYCIEEYSGPASATYQVENAKAAAPTNLKRRHCFRGRNHRRILDVRFIGEKWSSASMNLADVQVLFGELRAKNKGKPRFFRCRPRDSEGIEGGGIKIGRGTHAGTPLAEECPPVECPSNQCRRGR